MPPPPVRIFVVIFLGSLMPFSVTVGLMMLPPSGWQTAHLALKSASPLGSAAKAADACRLNEHASVAAMRPFFIVRLLVVRMFPPDKGGLLISYGYCLPGSNAATISAARSADTRP